LHRHGQDAEVEDHERETRDRDERPEVEPGGRRFESCRARHTCGGLF
jgi:hypothetical protein